MNIITLEKAEQLAILSTNKAKAINVNVNIAIVDPAGHLITFKRMNNALLGAIDIAIKKAKTAALFQKPTQILGEKSQPGEPLYNIELSNNGLITFAGGLPIVNKKHQVVAAIGVSGSTVENDLIIANAALEYDPKGEYY